LVILAFFTVSVGLINTPVRLTFEHFLATSFELVGQADPLDVTLIAVLAVPALVVATIGIVVSWRRYNTDVLPAEDGRFWERSRTAFGVDEFYGRTIVAPGKRVSEWAAETMDLKVIDGAVHGIGLGVRRLGLALTKVQTGQVREYAGTVAVAGVVLIVLFLVLGGGI